MMERYQQSYEEALEQNSANEKKWRKYRKDLEDTKANLSSFVKQRSVNVMVPLGKKAFVRGTLQHTNEVTVSHGSSLFSDVSTSQAVDILEHRIKSCDERLLAFEKERELFSNKLKLPEDAFGDSQGREIIEEYHEEEEKAWRRKHAESVRRFKQKEAEERQKQSQNEKVDVNEMLDQYEMMEELANELDSLDIDDDEKLQKLLNGEVKDSEFITKTAQNLGSLSNVMEVEVESGELAQQMEIDSRTFNDSQEKKIPIVSDANNNDLIAQSNHEIVDLLKTYRSKIKDVLRNVRKDDERSVNLFLDLIELKDDIEDDIRKLNDDGSMESGSDEKDSDDDTMSIEVTPKGTKRKVRFSTSLEDVKLIEPKEHYNTYNEVRSDSNTIQIDFTHSDAKFNPQVSSGDDGVIAHPGEIHKMFIKPNLTPITTTKSILKKSGDLNSPTIPEEVKPVKKVFQSDFQVLGDVMEHKKATVFNDEVIHITSKDVAPKKVSKFKQMRLKS